MNSPRRFYDNGAYIRHTFGLLGEKIATLHLKDIRLREDSLTVAFEEVLLGTGGMDYVTLMDEIAKLPEDTPAVLGASGHGGAVRPGGRGSRRVRRESGNAPGRACAGYDSRAFGSGRKGLTERRFRKRAERPYWGGVFRKPYKKMRFPGCRFRPRPVHGAGPRSF